MPFKNLDWIYLIVNYDSMTDRIWFHTLIGTSCLVHIINIPRWLRERSSFSSNNNIIDLHLNRWKNWFKLNCLCTTFSYNAKHLEYVHQSFSTSSAFAQKSRAISQKVIYMFEIKMNINFYKWYEISLSQ